MVAPHKTSSGDVDWDSIQSILVQFFNYNSSHSISPEVEIENYPRTPTHQPQNQQDEIDRSGIAIPKNYIYTPNREQAHTVSRQYDHYGT